MEFHIIDEIINIDLENREYSIVLDILSFKNKHDKYSQSFKRLYSFKVFWIS
jgi:hypothetical protein